MPKKGKRKKGKKGKKKKKEVPQPPPLHELTTLYNQLADFIEDFRVARNKARKKRVDAWYMVREMMSLSHDNAVYHKYLQEKMDQAENILNELTRQLNEEREEVEKIIKRRIEEIDRIIEGYKARSAKAEQALLDLKTKLQEFEPLMRELAALMAKLKELQALIPIYELEANIKTRHLKNQYLSERAKLHNHLESELYLLILTCRSHLMPILADHMTSMELENRCSRWELGNLDMENFKLYRKREKLLERRNRLNMEREYLSIDWAFNKLGQVDARHKARDGFKTKKPLAETEDDCELAIAFRAYLSKKLGDIDKAKEREARLKARREAKQKKLQRELEKKKREAILAQKRAKALLEKARKEKGLTGAISDTEDEEEDEYEDEWGELEYYEDDEGNWVIATHSRMLQHKAILENKALDEVEQQVEDIKQMISSREDGESGSESSSGSSGSFSDDASEGSLESVSDLEEDQTAADGKQQKTGGFDDDFDDNFGFDDDGNAYY